MKYPIYLRVAQTGSRKGYQVSASTIPNNEPLKSSDYRGTIFHPTVAFGVNIDLPDELFKQAERVIAELNVSMKDAKISGEIVVPKGITIKTSKNAKG